MDKQQGTVVLKQRQSHAIAKMYTYSAVIIAIH